MSAHEDSLTRFEAELIRFKPDRGLAATNPNDVRRFVYDWFTHFEHATPASYYLEHLDGANLRVAIPGVEPITSHAAFSIWYDNLIAQTVWNFHDLGRIEVQRSSADEFLITFVVDWNGEVRSDSDQLAGWQVRGDSFLYHHHLRQTWTMTDQFLISRLTIEPGDTPSPTNS
jgi:hypothetical protein